jgi:hypothetical protein
MNDKEFQKYHKPHPCQFCGQGAGYAPLPDRDTKGVSIYFCHPCQAEYLVYWDGPQASVSLYTEINGETYRWTSTNANTYTLNHIIDPGVPGVRGNGDIKLIRYFRDIPNPNVTPQNVKEKVRTWLVFL